MQNLNLPVGGSARYTGETIALQKTAILTGTVQADVSWTNTTPDTLNAGTSLGTIALTISDLASATGDALSQGGSTETGSLSPGNEIADIVFPGLSIVVGAQGTCGGNMIVGTAGEAVDGNVCSYNEVAVSSARYRRAISVTTDGDIELAGSASVKALFAGQGVDGALGVIGTWTMTDSTVGRVNGAGTSVDDLGATIYIRCIRSRGGLASARIIITGNLRGERETAPPFSLCVEHDRQLEGESSSDSLMEVKSWRSVRASSRGGI